MARGRYVAGWFAGLLAGLTIAGSSAAALEGQCPAALADQPIGFNLDSLEAARLSSRSQEPALRATIDALVSRAESHLSVPFVSVTDKSVAGPSGDKRDYVSLAPYWWPDPQSSDGLPYVRRDGETNPEREGETYDRVRMQDMVDRISDLSLAAYLTGDKRYADYAVKQIRVWFVESETRMNPNLQYAQSIPGRADGRYIGIIDSRILVEVVDAAALLKISGELDPETEAGIRSWIGAYAAWLIQSEFGLEERSAENNHGTFYDAQLAHFLVYVGRCDLVRRVLEDTKARIVGQIKPNGFQPLEVKRTRSLHYHAFNLEAFLRLALIAERLEVSLYDYEVAASGSIRDGVHLLAEYAGRTEKWPHQRLDDTPPPSLWIALIRANGLDPTDRKIGQALEGAQGGDANAVLGLKFYNPSR